VLCRIGRRLRLDWADHAVVAGLIRLLPRSLWMSRLGTPGPCSGGTRTLSAASGRGGWDAAGSSWTWWDMIHKLDRPDQPHPRVTDATRTAARFHPA
jgi:hypothetical protein